MRPAVAGPVRRRDKTMLWIIAGVILVGVVRCAWASRGTSAVTPGEALARLKEGNARFADGRGIHPNADAARRQETTAEGQHPVATVVSCSDSRVPVEILFDQGIGDVFVVRVPGNVCNADEIGAVEYGVEHLNTPLCVILGHTRCGAVTGVVMGEALHGNLASLVTNIRNAAVKARKQNPTLDDAALVEPTARANVQQSIDDLLRGSPSVRELSRQGSVKIIGAMYDIATGRVEWIA